MEILFYRLWEPAGYYKREYWKAQSKGSGIKATGIDSNKKDCP